MSFVRASVRAIGRCALKLDSASDRCVNSKLLNRLLVCLDECSEWGQITILDVSARDVPEGEAGAMLIVAKT